jgi:hypothetical protein
MLKVLALTLLVATFLAAGFFARTDTVQSKGLEIATGEPQVLSTLEIPLLAKKDREDRPKS